MSKETIIRAFGKLDADDEFWKCPMYPAGAIVRGGNVEWAFGHAQLIQSFDQIAFGVRGEAGAHAALELQSSVETVASQ